LLLAEARIEEVVALVAKLAATNAALLRMLETRSASSHKNSEIVSPAQLALLLSGLAKLEGQERPEDLSKVDDELREKANIDALGAEDKDEDAKKKDRKHSPRRPFPDKLRRVENVIRVPTEQRACPRCGGERKCIGHDVTETLDLIPAEFVVRQDKREKLACEECEGKLCRAPLPDKLIERGRFGIQLAACIVVDKYHDGLPLHRHRQRFERLGVSMPISTLVDQVTHVANAMTILQQAAMLEVLASHVMHLDGTGMPVLDEYRNETRLGTLWCYVGDGNVSFCLYNSTGKKNRRREDELGPEDVLTRRSGLVVCDASGLFVSAV